MKTPHTKPVGTQKKWVCMFIGHRYQPIRKITNHFNEYECKCCGKQVADDPRGKLIVLTPQIKEINETLQYMFLKKRELELS